VSYDKNYLRKYYTDILGGYTYSDLKKLRSKLSSTHHSLFNLSYKNSNDNFSANTINGIKTSPLFRSSETGIIQNFELLLTYRSKSYFEISLENKLNVNVNTKDAESVGYKIQDTHFRLGSKTHISEFVYAKRIFQNSFYSDRFAFLIAKYVKEKFHLSSNTTVLGYGDYSQLVVNRTTEILRKVYDNFVINNDIIRDIEELKLIKEVELYDNIIVLVPINTTFSTSIKIENLVREKNTSGREIHIIPINLVLVSHNNLENSLYVDNLNEYLHSNENSEKNNRLYPYKLFHWKDVNAQTKIVEVETNPPEIRITKQKYFITISSSWTLPEDCVKCFPVLRNDVPKKCKDYRLLEKPLLETDKASVTPNLLLDIPKNFRIDAKSINSYSSDKYIFLNEEAYFSGHIEYRKTHYINFIEPIIFYEEYINEITKWAEDCRRKLLEADSDILNTEVSH